MADQILNYINNEDVINRLNTRLSLSVTPQVKNPLVLPRMVQPTLDVSPLLLDSKILVADTNVTATGNIATTLIVPERKRWHLYGVHIQLISGTFTISELHIRDDRPNPDVVFILKQEGTPGTFSHWDGNLLMDYTQYIEFKIAAESVAGVAETSIIFGEEYIG